MAVQKPNRNQFHPATSRKKRAKEKLKTFPNGHWLLPFAAGIIVSLVVIVGAYVLYYK